MVLYTQSLVSAIRGARVAGYKFSCLPAEPSGKRWSKAEFNIGKISKLSLLTIHLVFLSQRTGTEYFFDLFRDQNINMEYATGIALHITSHDETKSFYFNSLVIRHLIESSDAVHSVIIIRDTSIACLILGSGQSCDWGITRAVGSWTYKKHDIIEYEKQIITITWGYMRWIITYSLNTQPECFSERSSGRVFCHV